MSTAQFLWRFLGTIGQNPSVSKSNQLHVASFWHFFISWGLLHRTLSNDWQSSWSPEFSTGYFSNSQPAHLEPAGSSPCSLPQLLVTARCYTDHDQFNKKGVYVEEKTVSRRGLSILKNIIFLLYLSPGLTKTCLNPMWKVCFPSPLLQMI